MPPEPGLFREHFSLLGPLLKLLKSSPAMFVALGLGDAGYLRHIHAGVIPLPNSGARGAVDTLQKAPLVRALPIHESALGFEAAELFGEDNSSSSSLWTATFRVSTRVATEASSTCRRSFQLMSFR